jgi:hypothetical protein
MMKLGTLGLALVFLLVSCGLSTGLPDPPGPDELDVRVGDEASIPGTVVRLGFERVSGDSRCPIGAVCVWEGDAAVEIGLTAGTGPTQAFELHTTLDPRFTDFAGVRVTLVGLAPGPREGQAIDPNDYVARFRVEAITP